MPVKKGDKVKVEYEGKLKDGSVFDSSDGSDEALEFEVGGGVLMAGFEDAVIGMEVGEEKEFELASVDAYGDYNDELIKDVPKDQIPKCDELEAGMILLMTLPNGIQIPASIVDVTDDSVKIDLNHPLAGQDLKFKIKLVEIAA